MSSFAEQQRLFMSAAGQSVGYLNPPQVVLYDRLVCEEFEELRSALESWYVTGGPADMAKVLDGCADLIVVALGLMHSTGVSPDKVWEEVMGSNLRKIHPDGRVHKRHDGKVLKPGGWVGPDLLTLVQNTQITEGNLA